MEEFKKPETIDLEVILNPTKVIMSKTNKDGVLEFANDYFVEVSGYEEYELMGKSIYCTQHPDMPEIIFKMMWEKLLKKQNFHVLIKNLAKNGKYYWAVSDFAFKTDEETGDLIAIYNRRKSASREAIKFFSKLYSKLKNIETESGVDLSEKYLIGHLEEIGETFPDLLQKYNTDFSTEKTTSKAPSTNAATQEKTVVTKEIKPKKIEVKQSVQKKSDIQIKTEKVVKKTPTETSKNDSKKSFFQKMFGKTDEELAAEKLEDEKNSKK